MELSGSHQEICLLVKMNFKTDKRNFKTDKTSFKNERFAQKRNRALQRPRLELGMGGGG